MFGLTPYTGRTHTTSFLHPFSEIDALEKSFFGSNVVTEFKTDIRDNGESYTLEADLPGFQKEDIHVDAENGYLTISAERHCQKNDTNRNGAYIRQERFCGSFTRSFDISEVDEERIKAKFENGVLTLELPKTTERAVPSKRIDIE